MTKLRYSENSAEREEREHSKFSVENYACFMNNDNLVIQGCLFYFVCNYFNLY